MRKEVFFMRAPQVWEQGKIYATTFDYLLFSNQTRRLVNENMNMNMFLAYVEKCIC